MRYRKFERKDDDATPPISAEESAISARLLSDLLKPGEGPMPVFLVEVFVKKESGILG